MMPGHFNPLMPKRIQGIHVRRTSMEHKRTAGQFASSAGFILAAVGSAVGMGTVSYTHLTLPTTSRV